ncbi:hypothetical protein ACH5RR_026188 [Cinchona calisaya]|uniref:Uncharacterized protein n=1 Tax=Cinchona calisaya TaxID=153742 RepID=A0ABD2Z1U3_9GENT
MDLWSINAKNTSNRGPFLLRNSIPENTSPKWSSRRTMAAGISSSSCATLRIVEIRLSRKKYYGYESFVVRAMGKKNNDSNSSSDNSSSSSSSGNGNQSSPEDVQKGSNPPESDKSEDMSSQKSHRKPLDWREFRAGLYIQEQSETTISENHKQDQTTIGPKPLPQKWAHPISAPENGCLLVATEKLDGVRTFERTVVLLLRSGTRHPQEGPFGIVINRPLHKRIKHMKPTNLDLQTTFADCALHFGGPLEASMFLLRAGENSELHGFEEVIPGVCFGARNSLDEASALVKKGVLKPHDFRFFVGYAGWQIDQLREEIESDYWYVAACSPNLIFGGSQNSSSEGLWEDILQLMGGHYSELSRKPKQDL